MYGTFNSQLRMTRTEKATKAVGRSAWLEHSGGATPDLWRPPGAGPTYALAWLT